MAGAGAGGWYCTGAGGAVEELWLGTGSGMKEVSRPGLGGAGFEKFDRAMKMRTKQMVSDHQVM